MTDQEKENMAQGVCRYCGQTIFVGDSIGGMTEEELNEAATCKCACSEAKSYVRKKERRKKVDEFVSEVFASPTMQKMIQEMIACVEGFEIDKATIKTPDGWTTTIYMDKDSYLNIKRKATKLGKELKA